MFINVYFTLSWCNSHNGRALRLAVVLLPFLGATSQRWDRDDNVHDIAGSSKHKQNCIPFVQRRTFTHALPDFKTFNKLLASEAH